MSKREPWDKHGLILAKATRFASRSGTDTAERSGRSDPGTGLPIVALGVID